MVKIANEKARKTMVGILVQGNNHFVLSGPCPTEAEATMLLRHWSIVQIGEAKSQKFERWEIRNKEFRESLEWAVIVPGDRKMSPAILQLLTEFRRKYMTVLTGLTGWDGFYLLLFSLACGYS